jgi:hypothetical protein
MMNRQFRFLICAFTGTLALIASAVSLTIGTDQAVAQARPRAPQRVQIVPNAIQDPNVPLEVRIQNGEPKQQLYLFILRSCDGDDSDPEIGMYNGKDECEPLWRKEVTLGIAGDYRDKLPLNELSQNGQPLLEPLPVNTPLWLRVSATPSGKRYKRDTMFMIAADPCTVWRTLLNPFTRGRCHTGVTQAFMPQKGIVEELPHEALQVRRMDIARWRAGDKRAAMRVVPGTVGATGVQWSGNHQMVVTLRGPTAQEQEAAVLPPDKGKPLRWSKPGLYWIDLRTGKKKQLYQSPEHTIPGAPYAVSRDCVVFIEDTEYEHGKRSRSSLVIWERGRKVRKYPMDRSLHQIFGVDRKNRAIIAYSVWKRSPTVVRVSLENGDVVNLGDDARLLHALLYSDRNQVGVQAIENNASEEYGWEMILVDDRGNTAGELLVEKGHDLMPVWRPDEAEIAYLGQVKR